MTRSMPTKEAKKPQEERHVPEGKAQTFPVNSAILGTISKGMGVSGVLGAAVGVATRRLTKDALYGAGIAVVVLQGLSYLGYITINWGKVETDATRLLDQNGDGRLDSKDVKLFLNRFLKFASAGLSDAGGFAGGFLFGAKYLA